VCDENYSSLRKAAEGCGYSPAMVSMAVNGLTKMPPFHNWIKLSEKSND